MLRFAPTDLRRVYIWGCAFAHLGSVTGVNPNHALLVPYSLLWFEHQNILLCIWMHTKPWHPKWSIRRGVRCDIYGQSLHPSRATTFIINHFGSAKESFSSYFCAPIVIVHCFLFPALITISAYNFTWFCRLWCMMQTMARCPPLSTITQDANVAHYIITCMFLYQMIWL